jgi:hypothetical protein
VIRCATLTFALVASIPVAKAQSPVTQRPYEAFVVQPSGMLIAPSGYARLGFDCLFPKIVSRNHFIAAPREAMKVGPMN